MQRALQKKLIGPRAHRELLAFLGDHLPPFKTPAATAAWLKKAPTLRREMLDLFFRGHPQGLLTDKPQVHWGDRIQTGKGYIIRKLRYEGYPGLWVPALLYEPSDLKGPAPAVLNPNGHHAGGKAMDYKQARCINLAKRGMLALNTEFIGMGELRADADHNRIAHLDLCGIAGIGVFYLLIKRGLDVLLAHPNADSARTAMTGLSGGGWQTALLSALDERVKVIVPVAGHSPVWQRRGCIEDIGDQEQCPSDLCTVADFDELSALFAPRPTLLVYNRNDDCCFQTKRTRKSIYKPIRPVFDMLGAGDKLALHDNTDPGTHNYDRDNRRQLYKFLDRHFGLDTSDDDLPWRDELLSEDQLNVGLPPDNATLHSIAQERLRKIRSRKAKTRTPAAARKALAELIKLPRAQKAVLQKAGAAQKRRDCTIQHYLLRLGDTWTLPLTEFAPPRVSGCTLLVADGGRSSVGAQVNAALAEKRRVFAADLFGTGELRADPRHHMLVATAGQRPLGVQVGQLLALLDTIGKKHSTPHLISQGQVVSIIGLFAAALKPKAVVSLTTNTLLDTLGRLVDWPQPYASAPSLFCFGLLAEFDLPDLIALCAPVALYDDNRGPCASSPMRLLGPLAIVLSFALMRLQIEPFATFFYLFAWYGLIFTFDQLIRAREGHSLIARCQTSGNALLLFWSAVCWFFFELINFRLDNWYYIFVTDQPVLRLIGTFLAFATVFPGIFWIEHYLHLRGVCAQARWRPLRFSPRGLYLLQCLGALSLVLPLLWPRYFFPLVWGALILLIAPINYRRGLDGYLRQLERGDYGQTLRLLLAGLITGLCWEFFNFWARAKWIYTVPFFDELKLFEMPLAGFIGFPPFAVECAIVYRLLVWHHLAPAFGAYREQKPQPASTTLRAALITIALIAALGVDYYMARWTVTSVTPRIERIETLDGETLQTLHRNGINHLTQLQGWIARKQWPTLQNELSAQQYADLQRITALYLHQGIGIDYGNWLVRANITSLNELATYTPVEVLDKLAHIKSEKPLPSPAKVHVWIRRALNVP